MCVDWLLSLSKDGLIRQALIVFHENSLKHILPGERRKMALDQNIKCVDANKFHLSFLCIS